MLMEGFIYGAIVHHYILAKTSDVKDVVYVTETFRGAGVTIGMLLCLYGVSTQFYLLVSAVAIIASYTASLSRSYRPKRREIATWQETTPTSIELIATNSK
mmetsp:Transcript_25302/g.28951  ORF Transcript_25302/g.28951 Transcript_25302/m.28951 type:complete len:101 (-) Transcript_25302:1417-1719(-)